jgi:hypothetical protein
MTITFESRKCFLETPLSPEYIVGFTDGEGSFTLHSSKRRSSRYGLFVTPSLSLSQNTASEDLLLDVKRFFGCGFLRKERGTTKYEVRSLKDLKETILPFFEKSPLRTAKKRDARLLSEICEL